MVYIIKSTVSLTGSLSGEPEDDQGLRVIIIGCCLSCAEQPQQCWTFPTGTFREAGLQNHLQSYWIPLSSQEPGRLWDLSSFRKGVYFCSIFAITSCGCQWLIHRTSSWKGKKEPSPSWQNRCLNRKKEFSQIVKTSWRKNITITNTKKFRHWFSLWCLWNLISFNIITQLQLIWNMFVIRDQKDICIT